MPEDHCCCCCSFRTGAIIIGSFKALSSVVLLILVLISNASDRFRITAFHHYHPDLEYLRLKVLILFCTMDFIVNVTLLIGAWKRIIMMVLTFFVINSAVIGWACIGIIMEIVGGSYTEGLCWIPAVLVAIYYTDVIAAFIKKLESCESESDVISCSSKVNLKPRFWLQFAICFVLLCLILSFYKKWMVMWT